MTVNELVGQIEIRIKELGRLSMDDLRMEHPEVAGDEIPTRNAARLALRFKGKEDLIAEIIVEEFSLDNDVEIDV